MVLKTVSTLGGGGGGGGGGNVSGVSASLPVISSEGTTPNISFISPGTAGNVLTSIGGVWVSNAAVSGGGNGTPGGANTTIQFNNSGAFGGSANLTWDGSNVQIGSSGLFKLSNGVTNYVSFRAPNVISSNVTWTLPNTDGTDGQVLITNGAGVLSWATPTLTPTAPTNNTLPIVSGTAIVGQILSSTTGTWSGYPTPTFAYQWIRDAATNVGTNSPSYQLVDDDLGSTVKCRVTATNSAGSANATSASTATIAAGPPQAPTSVTAVAGNAQATISFTAPAITGGSPIVYYEVTCVENGFINSGPSSPVTITGLTNGVSYTFIVRAINGFGTSPAGGPSNAVVPANSTTSVEYLVVGGGGGGGSDTNGVGGGGGAGGLLTNVGGSAYSVVAATLYTVTVGGGGAGGAAANNSTAQGSKGSVSSWNTTAVGGGAKIESAGGGGGVADRSGAQTNKNGGSGAGGAGSASTSNNAPGTGTAGQGSDGGSGALSGGSFLGSGGGGGAGGVGSAGTTSAGGNGGAGAINSITGSSVYYAYGGGGGGYQATAGNGGTGASGSAGKGGTATSVLNTAPFAADVNTGGGGGGTANLVAPGSPNAGGNGGKGVVIIRYPDTFANATVSGATLSVTGGYKIYRFTDTGSITF